MTREEDRENVISQLHSVPKSLTPLNPRLGETRNVMPYLIPAITFSRLPLASRTVSVKRRIVFCSLSGEYVFKFTFRYRHL